MEMWWLNIFIWASDIIPLLFPGPFWMLKGLADGMQMVDTSFKPCWKQIWEKLCFLCMQSMLFTPWVQEVQELKGEHSLDEQNLFTWRLAGVRGNFIEVTKWSETETLFKAYSSDVEVLPRTNHHCSSFICSKENCK